MRTVVFRVDASVSIGTGHWMRCLVLAQVLSANGCRIIFLTNSPPKACLKRLNTMGFMWINSESEADSLQWLAVQPNPIDALIVDHYGLNATWEAQAARLVKQLGVIDDLAHAPHYCDWLVNPSLHPQLTGQGNATSLYASYLPPHATVLMGPRYALLHHSFLNCPPRTTLGTSGPRHIGVCFGGSDPTGETSKLLTTLIAVQDNPAYKALKPCQWTIVAGGANAHWATLKDLAGQIKKHLGLRLSLQSEVSLMAPLMAQTDLWLGAGGTMTWERYATGLYGLIVAVAPNQLAVCQAMHQHGMGHFLGVAGMVSGQAMVAAVLDIVNTPNQRLQQVATLGPQWVDGQGALRVYETMSRHWD
jgi:UDP-2,4-diacetamido-2,4,6-trideoxy-beta-L-altropyranose hydrolase